MENVKDNEIDLGLSLGITNQHVESCSNTSAGAGANANSESKTDTIGESRPVTELVWSTKNGLSIKCAGCSNCFAGMKPCILMDIGPIHLVSPSQGDEKSVIAQATCHMSSVKSSPGSFLGSNLGQTDENAGEVKCLHFIKMENGDKGKEKECMSIQVENVAGTSEGPKDQRIADLLPLLVKEPTRLETKVEILGNDKDIFSLEIGFPLKMQDMRQSTCQECPLPDVAKEGSSSAPFLEKFEETAENDVIVKDDMILKGEASSRNEGGSMESCNSANLLSRRDKRLRFEEQLIIGSKRIKKQSQERHVVKQQDSSFMNWISNMLKGSVKPHQEVGHHHIDNDDKTFNVVNKRFGFQNVFQSLYCKDDTRLQTKLQIESSSKSSKEIVLFEKPPDDSLNQKAFGKSWITRFSPKTPSTSNNNSDLKDIAAPSVGSEQFKKPVAITSSYKIGALKKTTSMAIHSKITCIFCGQTGHELRDCLEMNENANVFFKKKVSNLDDIAKPIASSSKSIKVLNEDKVLRMPKQMFDTVRRLRLSRTDILKWMNSHLPISNLDGYFLRLRLAKSEKEVGGAGYYVAFITDETPSQGSTKPIRVNIGGVQCLVESRYISNCDFLENELIAWWQTTLTSGQVPVENDLTSKLEERKKLGF